MIALGFSGQERGHRAWGESSGVPTFLELSWEVYKGARVENVEKGQFNLLLGSYLLNERLKEDS